MNFLQYLIVAVIIGAALAYLVRYTRRMLSGRQSCGGCGSDSGCPKTSAKE